MSRSRLSVAAIQLVLCLAFVPRSQAQLFQSPVNYGTGGFSPTSVAIGDLNADGRLDVVAVNENSGTLSVLRGNGDGTLQAALTYPAGTIPYCLALGDFNRDGKLDAAVGNRVGFGTSRVSILLGNGDGSFQGPVSYGPLQDAFSFAVADFTSDRKLDMVVADGAAGALLLGKGDGTFRKGSPIGVTDPLAFAVGDFNGDHERDLAAASSSGSSVVALLGNGKGSFTQSSTNVVATPPDALVVADFNRDGFLDVASADEAVNNLGSNVAILLGNGDGTFHSAVEYPVGAEPRSIAARELNGDQKIDLVTANEFDGTLSVLLGNGDGTFQLAITFASGGTTPNSVAAGDLNGDGRPDLVVAQMGNDAVSVLLHN
jgi:hypothetical protein